jgi:hypothetical protein
MFTPLFFRRLIFVADFACLGACIALHGLPSLAFFLLSLLCSVAEYYLAKHYGLPVEPLTPALRLAGRLRLLRTKLHALPKLARVALLGLVALVIFCCLPSALRSTIMPTAGGFTPDNLGAYTLGAFQFFAALSMAYVAWRGLFPNLYAYAAETMEGKLLESITTDLLTRLPIQFFLGQEDITRLKLAALAERRKIATFQFTVRCARFAFSVLPFFVFFFAANASLTSALTVVPPAAVGR